MIIKLAEWSSLRIVQGPQQMARPSLQMMGSTNTEEEAVAQLDVYRSAFSVTLCVRTLSTQLPVALRGRIWLCTAPACCCS